MVERYRPNWNAGTNSHGVHDAVDGEFVRHSDYAALEAKLAEVTRQRDLLAEAIGEAARKAGIYNGEVELTGPRLLMLVDDMAENIVALEATPPAPKVTEAPKIDGAVAELFVDAWAEAEKAMRKFPQPNYVISKVAEEAGEVVKAAIHCAEGRETPENVVAEIKQAMAMLIRLYLEGDQVHGLLPLTAAQEAGRA